MNQQNFLRTLKISGKVSKKKVCLAFLEEYPYTIMSETKIYSAYKSLRKSEPKRSRHIYTDEQIETLRTCNLPGSSLKEKKRWEKKMNKELGTTCTWDALLNRAKVLRGDWVGSNGIGKKNPKPQDTRVKGGKKALKLSELHFEEYCLMVDGGIVWQGDCEPGVFRFKKTEEAVAKADDEIIWRGEIDSEVVVGVKDLD